VFLISIFMALYNKYRPQDFSEVVGQEHITTILAQAAKEKAFTHAYLLVGPRGTGKTTTARLIAKGLGAKDMDVLEIDAASHTGVDEMRDIIEKARFAPTVSEAKVYIVDEVHMLSKSAFNALLKILEEPPSHVYFVLATTEIHKVPVTIISRCQRFDFHRIDEASIIDRLKDIASKEGIECEDEALQVIAKNADGSLRDAITLFEQVTFEKKLSLEKVEECLGVVRMVVLEEFISLLLTKKGAEAVEKLEGLYKDGINIAQFVKETLTALRYRIFEKASEEEMKELLSISRMLLEKDFKTSSNPLFELELLVYKIAGGEKNEKHEARTEKQEEIEEEEEEEGDSVEASSSKGNWEEVIENIENPHLKLSAKMLHIKEEKENDVTLSTNSSFHFENCRTVEAKAQIEEAFQKVFGKDIVVKVVLEEKPSLTVEKSEEVEQKQKKKSLVSDALEVFGD